MVHLPEERAQLHEQPCQDCRDNNPIPSPSVTSPSANAACAPARKEAESDEEAFIELKKRDEKQTPKTVAPLGCTTYAGLTRKRTTWAKRQGRSLSARRPAKRTQLPRLNSTTSTVYHWVTMLQVRDRNTRRAAGSIPATIMMMMMTMTRMMMISR